MSEQPRSTYVNVQERISIDNVTKTESWNTVKTQQINLWQRLSWHYMGAQSHKVSRLEIIHLA